MLPIYTSILASTVTLLVAIIATWRDNHREIKALAERVARIEGMLTGTVEQFSKPSDPLSSQP